MSKRTGKVPYNCPKCKQGVLWRYSLSRMAESLGQRGYECERCHARFTYNAEETER